MCKLLCNKALQIKGTHSVQLKKNNGVPQNFVTKIHLPKNLEEKEVKTFRHQEKKNASALTDDCEAIAEFQNY